MQNALSKAKELHNLGAIVKIDADFALNRAQKADEVSKKYRGCFHGVPFLGKDLGSSSFNLTTSGGVLALRKKLEADSSESDLFSKFHFSQLLPASAAGVGSDSARFVENLLTGTINDRYRSFQIKGLA